MSHVFPKSPCIYIYMYIFTQQTEAHLNRVCFLAAPTEEAIQPTEVLQTRQLLTSDSHFLFLGGWIVGWGEFGKKKTFREREMGGNSLLRVVEVVVTPLKFNMLNLKNDALEDDPLLLER